MAGGRSGGGEPRNFGECGSTFLVPQCGHTTELRTNELVLRTRLRQNPQVRSQRDSPRIQWNDDHESVRVGLIASISS
ncbi:MAG TPA: hypothetical protein VID95_07645 [Candidatus Limnocylindrales bacterium]|jgi:hypothetical protein